ncbi:MAG: VOC family protein [Devosia sp.]|uniref:VOC family protein n=1 Tax=Devosia sp. TaxID=1871048 RepID=UPI003393F771
MSDEDQLHSVGQVSRHVLDIEASTGWYRDVLGLTHLYRFGALSFFDCGGLRLYLQESPEAGPESVLYFRVDNIEASYQTLSGRGAEFMQTPHLIHRHEDGTEEWMAFFGDLEGRPLALMAQKRG